LYTLLAGVAGIGGGRVIVTISGIRVCAWICIACSVCIYNLRIWLFGIGSTIVIVVCGLSWFSSLWSSRAVMGIFKAVLDTMMAPAILADDSHDIYFLAPFHVTFVSRGGLDSTSLIYVVIQHNVWIL